MSGCVNLSLNEVDSLAKRAARGAGYSWGLAEEAGKAVRWMCVHGLDGIGQLASLLQTTVTESPDKHRPKPSGDATVWRASDQLCPLVTGAYLSDSAKILRNNKLEIQQVIYPGLLLPFVANVALKNEQILAIECNTTVAMTDGKNLEIRNTFTSTVSDVQIFSAKKMDENSAKRNRVIAQIDNMQVLERYAQLTHAPATEESRLLGAGTSLSDND